MRTSSRLTAALIAIGSMLFSPVATGPALAAEPTDPLVVVLPPTASNPDSSMPAVTGPFDMVVEVTGGGTQDLTLTPLLTSWGWSTPTAKTITIAGGTCLDSCRVSWKIDPASENAPWYGPGRLDVVAVMGDRSLGTSGTSAYYVPPVTATWVVDTIADATSKTAGGAGAVFDTGGEVVFAGPSGRVAGEQVKVSVIRADGDLSSPRLMSWTGTWSSDPDSVTGSATGRARIDTSTLPEGRYRLVAQAYDSAGHFGYVFLGGLAVAHSPLVLLRPVSPGIVAAGQDITVTVDVRQLRFPEQKLGALRLTAGGVTRVIPADSYSWFAPRDTNLPASRSLSLPTTGLPLGPAMVTAEVLDVTGTSIGTASSTINVVDYKMSLTIPTLFVGRTSAVRLTASAPAGTALIQCNVSLQKPLESYAYNLCPGPRATSVNATAPIVPVVAGTGILRADIMGADGVVGPVRDVPVTVYANRTAALTAPVAAAWGTAQTASVTVLDEKRVGVRNPAAGVNVTLQRKNAGSTTWTTIGTATTGSTGVAAIRYSHNASGRLRALVNGAAPRWVLTTAERATTSVATVVWSSLPTSSRSGSVLTAAVAAKPYEKGATVRFQARKLGTTTWINVGTGVVGTSGYTRATARLWPKGTWEVRIQRVASTTQAAGYSSVRRIKII